MGGFIYILTTNDHKVLYIGVTNNLRRRLYEHKMGMVEGFTRRYGVHQLVYYEQYNDIEVAIKREKQLKGWKRIKKEWLINKLNPEWKDLSEEWKN